MTSVLEASLMEMTAVGMLDRPLGHLPIAVEYLLRPCPSLVSVDGRDSSGVVVDRGK